MRPAAALLIVGLAVAPFASACAGEHDDTGAGPARATSQATSPQTAAATGSTAPPRPTRVHLRPLRVATGLRAVDQLARVIGPRQATGPDFRRASAWLAERFREAGYAVRREPFPVPGGDSWGVPVSPGRSMNVIATPQDFDPRRPHLVVGAHLDTVPQSPGAEDDASGIGVLLMIADALSGASSAGRLPVVLIGFGAEEPRGPTDADHHYGSRAYVAGLSQAQRQAVRGMLALDRVGVGDVVPVCTAGDDVARGQVLRAGRRADVPMQPCENRSSDHWSFVERGMPGVRLGGTSYAGYHSPSDVPSVVNAAQLRRTARLVLAWIE